jgi:hypothetical protein
MSESSVHYEHRGWIEIINPNYKYIQVGGDSTQHKGRNLLFIQMNEAAKQIGQQCMRK